MSGLVAYSYYYVCISALGSTLLTLILLHTVSLQNNWLFSVFDHVFPLCLAFMNHDHSFC